MPRLFRQSPLLSIWEGSGNVVCLDVLRAAQREPETVEALLDEIRLAGLPQATAAAEQALATLDEGGARRAVERLALALQASLLARYAPAAVADAFVASRLDGAAGLGFGTLPAAVEPEAIVERHRPVAN